MNANPSQTVVVILPYYYGKGASLSEAVAAAKKAGYKPPRNKRAVDAMVLVLSAPPSEIKLYGDVGVRWVGPAGTEEVSGEMKKVRV